MNEGLFNDKVGSRGPVACLGLTYPGDDERRAHFLARLRAGLDELDAKLGGIPFTTIADAVDRLRAVRSWPMGDDQQVETLAERMRHGAGHDLLRR
ncbi:MAG: hypothetical protein HYY04_04890, partial [Chloroflexi bacterium]|nr:hypothetical protein [Chloroflexota bacterium]